MDKYYIPQHLDAPFKIAMFTIADLVIILVPFLITAFIFQKQILALIVSTILFFAARKIKGEEDNHFYKHFIYWHFPPIVPYKAIPPSYVREVVG